MAFYDTIAKQWHTVTGFNGGALKRVVLNDLLIDAITLIHDRSIIELGAGNGYFLPLVLRRYSGQSPARLIITDQSKRQLELAQKHCMVRRAEYTNSTFATNFRFRQRPLT